MTREEAKQKIIRNNAEWVWYETIDKIFDEFGEKLQDKDDEIELLKCRIEEAMKPKTCNECEWWDFNSYGIFKKCFNGKGNCVSTKSSFGCNRFKQKDNA